MRLHLPRATSALALAACAMLTSCGSSPTSPTQPTKDGCTLVSASPAAGTQLKAGVPVTVTVTATCSLVSAESGLLILGGIIAPSSESTAAANRAMARGTTTTTMTVTFTLPPATTSIHVLMAVATSVGFSGEPVDLFYPAG
jgi:hypothetical protein